MSADDHGIKHYVKVWAVLLVLLVVSIVGPMFEIQVVTLVTAFGIAIVKATMVVRKRSGGRVESTDHRGHIWPNRRGQSVD